MEKLKEVIERAWEDRAMLQSDEVKRAVTEVIDLLDNGKVRVAEPTESGEWRVNGLRIKD